MKRKTYKVTTNLTGTPFTHVFTSKKRASEFAKRTR